LCTTALLPLAGHDPTLVIEWLPGTGPMSFGLGVTSLGAALVTTWVAFLALLAGSSMENEERPLSLALMLVALSAANAAFLTEHFLARYVALEVVALAIALAPLVELKGDEGGRGFWSVYIALRLGDVGLLTAILILFDASSTLQITPALETAGALGSPALGWVIFGLLLAVWVKLGNWPLHLWMGWGRALNLRTQAWLFATVMPNLGAYLLYRVGSIIVPSMAVQTLILWLGAAAAMLAVITALTRRDLRSGLIHIAAARGGLLVFAAATGMKGAVWLGLLVTTPVQLLLLLSGEALETGRASLLGRTAQGVFGLSGLTLAGVGLLITWWGRQAGVPLDALFVAEAAVALVAVWVLREAGRSQEQGAEVRSRPAQWAVMAILGFVTLVAVLNYGALIEWLMEAAGMAELRSPSLIALLSYLVTAPALLFTLVLVLVIWQMQRRARIRVHLPGPADGETVEAAYDLQEGLTEAARALRAIVEVGFLEQIIILSVRGVVDGARLTYQFVEQEGLEGLVRRVVQGVLAMSDAVRRRHTGLLRRNLLWIPLSLTLALVAALVLW
ncbi:MAG: proton-conducting transporter membrane subunit, partial [Chloroflexota bacterium]